MIEVIKAIALVCQIGSSGMGGEYNDPDLIKIHQKEMAKSNLQLQRNCVRELVKCVKTANTKFTAEWNLLECLEK